MLRRMLFDEFSLTTNIATLLLRLYFGGVLVHHGRNNFKQFDELSGDFPDPFGLGGSTSLWMAIIIQVFCGALLLLGLMTRVAAVPVIITFMVAILVAHAKDPFSIKELAVVYLLIAFFFLLNGPGDVSLDHLLFHKSTH